MLYITLSSRRIKRISICIAAVVLFTALFCLWAASVKNSLPPSASATDVSEADVLRHTPAFTVISPSEADRGAESEIDAQVGDQTVPANVSLYPFAINETVALPVKSAFISSEFGFRDHPVNGKHAFHSGLDLAAPEGTSIYAMLDGRVTTSKYASDYGNYIILDHGSFQTLYAHCLTLCVSEGDTVCRGQKIAEVGSTGRATGSHVHVEFRCNGQRYDPAKVLGADYS